MKHEIWLWAWFVVGMIFYWAKRAYYGINPPNPVATGYLHYLERSWVPLMIRMFIDSMAFWAMFTPGVIDRALNTFGWQGAAWAVDMVTQVGVFAATFGYTVDSIVDFAVTKIPWVKDILPQMPGPLPQQAPPDPDANTPRLGGH